MKDKIREQIEKFESAKNRGEAIDRHARIEIARMIIQKEESRTYRCPTVELDEYEVKGDWNVRRAGGGICVIH